MEPGLGGHGQGRRLAVVKDRAAPLKLPEWSRLAEWSILAVIAVVLLLVLARQVRVVQAQAELTSIKTTLYALRTALLMDHLSRNVAPEKAPAALTQRNPFLLLQNQPLNYGGVMTPSALDALPAGNWVFDPECVCVGYAPIYAQWFESPGGGVVAWFGVRGAPGPLKLLPLDKYVWQGQAIK